LSDQATFEFELRRRSGVEVKRGGTAK
jgi:hypothetical protein